MTGWSPARDTAPLAAVDARSTCPDRSRCDVVSLMGGHIPAGGLAHTLRASGKEERVHKEPEITVVVNPTKVDIEDVRATLVAVAEAAGRSAPTLVETTEDDPGFGQTRAAIESGSG